MSMYDHVVPMRKRIKAAVLLGIVVASRPGCASLDGEDGMVAKGKWGGDRLLIEVGDTIAQATYECAWGTLTAPILLADGRFSASGTYTQGTGVPLIGQTPAPVPARYSGRVDGDRMSVTVTLAGDNRVIGTYELRRGSAGKVYLCP